MTDLLIVADEAFLPHEIGTRYVRRCLRCNRPYGTGSYGDHADAFHNDGRTRYWRHRDRRRTNRGPAMTDPRSTPSIPVAPEPDDDFEEMLAGMDRIIHDKELQQQLLDAGLLVRIEGAGEARPTPVEPEARPLEALLLAAEEVDNAWYDDEGTVRFHEELWDRLVALRKANNAFEDWELAGGRLAVEPDGLPLDVARLAYAIWRNTSYEPETGRFVMREDDGPDELARRIVTDYDTAIPAEYTRLASTPSEAKP